jgi:hypothetical protein
MKNDIGLLKNIILRIMATFAASGLGVIGAGTIAGVPVWKAVFMAGIAGVATVVEGLARAFLNDGQLDANEINSVFAKVDKKAKPQEVAVVDDEDEEDVSMYVHQLIDPEDDDENTTNS